MRKDRLLILADYLENEVSKVEHRFNMRLWAQGEFCGLDNEPNHEICNTAACAIGWATTIPSFREAGLHLTLGNKPKYLDYYNFFAAASYEGWNNYETWLVNMFFKNDRKNYEMLEAMYYDSISQAPQVEDFLDQTCTFKEAVEIVLSAKIQDYIAQKNPLDGKNTIYADLLDSAIQDVNFFEIAEEFVKEMQPAIKK